jgi:hypothetical protein
MSIPRRPSSPSALKAALVAGVVASLPAIAYVVTRSSAHWPAMLGLGGVCAVAAAVCFGVYFRFATALVQHQTIASRMRLAASTEPAGMLPDPLELEERELEARFAEIARAERNVVPPQR